MPTSAERFYEQLNSVAALKKLLGQPEDADFDCKEWPSGPNPRRGTLAKAACGFTNATGGVIIIGLKASGRGSDTPDVVQELAPVEDRMGVASEALDIIHKLVEPGIEGVQWKDIPCNASGNSGFVIIFVPPSEGVPRRSKIDWRFYVRIASGTLPMEIFQIEERFGKKPFPRLKIHVETHPMQNGQGFRDGWLRLLTFGLTNEGRGIAKFPGIRFKRSSVLFKDDFGVDGNGGFGIPPRPSESGWIVFRGGVDDVIYPGETRIIGKLIQTAVHGGERGIPPISVVATEFEFIETLWVCEAMDLEFEISAEGVETKHGVHHIQEDSFKAKSKPRPS
jgi:hypothetical protein